MTKDDLHAFLRSRRSIRRFKPDPIPTVIIQRILDTAICAPSAHNLQPWRFVVLTGSEAKLHLAQAITTRFRQDMLADGAPGTEIQSRVDRTTRRTRQAPVVIVICRDKTRVKPESDEMRQQAEAMMGAQSVAVAGLQLLLAAHAEGLGGTWICWPLFAPEETRQALGLAPEWEPQGMIFLGYPAETPEMLERSPLQEVTRYA